MSNKARRLQKEIEMNKKYNLYEASSTLIGSIIMTVYKLVQKTEQEAVARYLYTKNNLSQYRSKWLCPLDIVNYFITEFNISDDLKKHIVLIVDDNQQFTPLVTLLVNNQLLPLTSDGQLNGILLAYAHAEDKNRFSLEYFYE